MSGRRYPPLTPDEVRDILKAKGFSLDRTRGSHEQWRAIINNHPWVVTVDSHYKTFEQSLIKRMISQSGLTREEFYSATKKTAKKIL